MIYFDEVDTLWTGISIIETQALETHIRGLLRVTGCDLGLGAQHNVACGHDEYQRLNYASQIIQRQTPDLSLRRSFLIRVHWSELDSNFAYLLFRFCQCAPNFVLQGRRFPYAEIVRDMDREVDKHEGA